MEVSETMGGDIKVSEKTGATMWARGVLYEALAQTVLLYGS